MTGRSLKGYRGRCHCGAIGYEFRSNSPPAEWPYRACQCAFCRAHDVISTSDPQGELNFNAAKKDRLQRYRFGLQTADFLLCRECGVYIGAHLATDKGAFGIVNLRALTEPLAFPEGISPAHYEEEDTAGRIARRAARWTPVTSVSW